MGATRATAGVAVDVSFAFPAELVAVTVTQSLSPTSAEVVAYVLVVAPLIAVLELLQALEVPRRH
jgi:hypothetical protein